MPCARRTHNRVELARAIRERGCTMSPCSNCRKSGDSCVVSAESKKCASCVRRGYRCDVVGPSARDFEVVAKELARLRDEQRATEQAERQAYRLLDEARARRDRLFKQQEFLRGREGELIRRGLETVEELEKAEEDERNALVAAQVATTTSSDLDLESLDPESWPEIDFGDTLATTAGS